LNVTALIRGKPMSEGFKIVICITGLMLIVGEYCLFQENNIFPGWMYVVMSFYIVVLWIDERLIPLMRDLDDLFKNSE
jgi:hypothetical protein